MQRSCILRIRTHIFTLQLSSVMFSDNTRRLQLTVMHARCQSMGHKKKLITNRQSRGMTCTDITICGIQPIHCIGPAGGTNTDTTLMTTMTYRNVTAHTRIRISPGSLYGNCLGYSRAMVATLNITTPFINVTTLGYDLRQTPGLQLVQRPQLEHDLATVRPVHYATGSEWRLFMEVLVPPRPHVTGKPTARYTPINHAPGRRSRARQRHARERDTCAMQQVACRRGADGGAALSTGRHRERHYSGMSPYIHRY